MVTNSNIKETYLKIQKQLFYMIPEKWESIYLYASVIEKINHIETGELFFYYFPKGILRKNPINGYEIPSKFNIEEESYIKLAQKLYDLIKKLRLEFKNAGEELWSNITIKIEKCSFIIEYHYDNYNMEEEECHRTIWSYQNLKIPLESYTKKERQAISQYINEEKRNPSKVQIYSEPVYKTYVKNVIQYNCEKAKYVAQDTKEEIHKKPKKIKRAYSNNYSHKTKKNLPIKERKKIKSKEKMPEVKLTLEQQIEQQMHAVRCQILSH